MAGHTLTEPSTLKWTASAGPQPAAQPRRAEYGPSLGRLWRYLESWTHGDGGVLGPVVHRCDLKRTFAIHDTPWTQAPIIRGLLELYRAGGDGYWLDRAVKLGDAQVDRIWDDGSFRWAGHEDDRFSSLVHNALADRALIDLAQALKQHDPARASLYLETAQRNLAGYLLDRLWDDRIGGMRMDARKNLPGAGRFVVNMNSVAADAMLAWDRCAETECFSAAAERIGPRLLELRKATGPWRGAFAYSHTQPDVHICLYTALALTGLPALFERTGDRRYASAASAAADHLWSLRDRQSGLWCHMANAGTVHRGPIFIAGAGMIASALLDIRGLTGRETKLDNIARAMLRHQHPHGGIANFADYDSPDNLRPGGAHLPCWEDRLPTPNWNAWAFYFLARMSRPPRPDELPAPSCGAEASKRYVWFESPRVLAVASWRPIKSVFAGLYCKRLRFGLSLSLPRIVQFFKRPLRGVARLIRRCRA